MGNDYEVPIYYQNPAGLSDDEINQLFRAVQGLYGPIRLNAQPMPAGQPMDNATYTVVFSGVPMSNREKMDDAYGRAVLPIHRAYVYPNQLQDSYGRETELRALEAVAGHELGHLLGLQHTLAGLMAPTIEATNLQNRLAPLSKGQIQHVEQTLDALRKARAIQQAKMGR